MLPAVNECSKITQTKECAKKDFSCMMILVPGKGSEEELPWHNCDEKCRCKAGFPVSYPADQEIDDRDHECCHHTGEEE